MDRRDEGQPPILVTAVRRCMARAQPLSPSPKLTRVTKPYLSQLESGVRKDPRRVAEALRDVRVGAAPAAPDPGDG